MSEKNIICIQGPTATGKSELALYIAQKINSEIISADSRQFYREMNIGTAKPASSDMDAVKHHFVDFLSIHDKYSAYDFEQQSLEIIEEIIQKGKIPVIVGGSGMYIDAIIKGFNNIPDVDQELRNNLIEELQLNGIEEMLKKLEELDPEYYQVVDRSNPRRVLRALEVTVGSGIPYSRYINKPKTTRTFKNIRIGISYPTEELYDRINHRCDLMLEHNLIEEVRTLSKYSQLNALKTIGYREFYPYINNEITLEFAIEKFKQHTRNFAKKQMSWLRRDKDIVWFIPPDKKQILDYITNFIN